MAGLDNIPQKTTVEIEVVKLDEDTLKTITELNQKSANIISEFGQIYIRKEELHEELMRLEEFLVNGKDEFKAANLQLKEVIDEVAKLATPKAAIEPTALKFDAKETAAYCIGRLTISERYTCAPIISPILDIPWIILQIIIV